MDNKLALQNYEYCQATLKLKERIENSFLELGQRLLRIRNEELFRPSYETFEDYVIEMQMSASNVSKLITIYERAVLRCGIAPKDIVEFGGWSLVYEVHRIAESDEEFKQFITDKKGLTLTDLRREETEKRKGVSQATCEHKNSYLIKVCRDCGVKHQVYEHE